MHAEQLVSDEDAIAARKRLVQAVFEWQAASSAAAASTVNVICDIVQGSSGESVGPVAGKQAGVAQAPLCVSRALRVAHKGAAAGEGAVRPACCRLHCTASTFHTDWWVAAAHRARCVA